ncbi:MAG: DUF2784 domain-containing protein, partial [Candidatus Marinimicrobia bacterium]|nr:DUF2784 domain-containing protein [Candidatus Neomarinimicrobiota bacterium]
MIGGFLVLRWWWVLFLHVPAAVWGALIEFQGWLCPLTPLELQLRQSSGQTGYTGGFIEHYILPIVYPSNLTHEVQIVLGTFVVVINVAIYGWMIAQHKRSKKDNA